MVFREDDINDLLAIRAGNRPPAFDLTARQRYEDLNSQGKNYQTGALVAFGLAGAAALTATVLFLRDGQSETETTRLVPVVGPGQVGAATTFRF